MHPLMQKLLLVKPLRCIPLNGNVTLGRKIRLPPLVIIAMSSTTLVTKDCVIGSSLVMIIALGDSSIEYILPVNLMIGVIGTSTIELQERFHRFLRAVSMSMLILVLLLIVGETTLVNL